MKKLLYIGLGLLIIISFFIFSKEQNTIQASFTYITKDNSTESQIMKLQAENKYLKDELERLKMLNVRKWNFNYSTGTLIDGFAFGKNYYCIWANGNDFNKQTWLMIHEYYHTKGYKHGDKMDKIVEDKWQNISQCLN